ncbi:MAG: putative membrane protein YedE/YeeE [Bradymonadia bacterium]|jgi:uncharacterized membrane protein YedE/YeeE
MQPDFWVMPLVGGALIGLSAGIMMFFHGKIAGISGIVGGLMTGDRGLWRLQFTIGLLIGGAFWLAMDPGAFALEIDRSYGALIAAGLLVGVGTRMGNGCTSGHGVCGIARKSRRSIVATLTFIFSGAVTVFIVRTVLGGSI